MFDIPDVDRRRALRDVAGEAAVDRDLANLLERCAFGDLPRHEIDRVLTDGYAAALEIETDRIELVRRIQAASPETAGHLREELASQTVRLAALRSRLAEASARFGRNPLAGF